MTRLAVPLLAAVVACGPARIAVTSQPAPTPTPSSSATPAPTRGAADAFVEIARAGASATYRITYLYRVVANAQTQTFESTWYVRPPEMRWDFTSPLGGTSSFYVLKGGVFVCSPAGQPSPSCFSLGSLAAAEQSSGAQVQELVREHPDRFTAT